MKPCALPMRRLVAAALGILLLLLILPSRTQPAAAEGAAAYGWWSQTTPTSAVTPPAPPDVPANGLFVENGPNGPVALSALTFAVPINAQIGELALTIAGIPALTRPPVACLATSAFSPVQNGAWTSRPTYDCSHEIPCNVDSNRTAVAFPVCGLAKNGELSIVVLAGRTVDRIAMNAPTANALTVTVAPGEVPKNPPGPLTVIQHNGPVPATSTSMPASSAPIYPTAIAEPPQVASQSPPELSPMSPGSRVPSRVQPVALGGRNSTTSTNPAGTRTELATTLGLVFLLLVIVYWADGFGAVPLRSWALARSRSSVDVKTDVDGR